jgi:hypothetical protein
VFNSFCRKEVIDPSKLNPEGCITYINKNQPSRKKKFQYIVESVKRIVPSDKK